MCFGFSTLLSSSVLSVSPAPLVVMRVASTSCGCLPSRQQAEPAGTTWVQTSTVPSRTTVWFKGICYRYAVPLRSLRASLHLMKCNWKVRKQWKELAACQKPKTNICYGSGLHCTLCIFCFHTSCVQTIRRRRIGSDNAARVSNLLRQVGISNHPNFS